MHMADGRWQIGLGRVACLVIYGEQIRRMYMYDYYAHRRLLWQGPRSLLLCCILASMVLPLPSVALSRASYRIDGERTAYYINPELLHGTGTGISCKRPWLRLCLAASARRLAVQPGPILAAQGNLYRPVTQPRAVGTGAPGERQRGPNASRSSAPSQCWCWWHRKERKVQPLALACL